MTNEQAVVLLKTGEAMKYSSDYGEAYRQAVKLLESTPDLRPMTLEEAVAYGKPVWVEWREPSIDGYWTMGVDARDAHMLNERRYWPDKPTPEQSAAHPWREEEA